MTSGGRSLRKALNTGTIAFLLFLPQILCNAQTSVIRETAISICISIAATLKKVTVQQGPHFPVLDALQPKPRFFGGTDDLMVT